MAKHSSILAWRIPMDRGAWQATVHGGAKSHTCLKWLSTHACTHEETDKPCLSGFRFHPAPSQALPFSPSKFIATPADEVCRVCGGDTYDNHNRKQEKSESCSVFCFYSFRPHGLYSPWNSPGQNTGVGSLSLLQGIFSTQRSNPGLLHCRRILYQLNHKRFFFLLATLCLHCCKMAFSSCSEGECGILEYEVKLALGSITMNKASGDDGIPVELFKILNDDAVKVFHSICQQIWKSQ